MLDWMRRIMGKDAIDGCGFGLRKKLKYYYETDA